MNFRNSPGDCELTNTQGSINMQTQMFLKPSILGNAGYDLESGKKEHFDHLSISDQLQVQPKALWQAFLILSCNLSLEHSSIRNCGCKEFHKDPLGLLGSLASEGPRTHLLQHA